MPLRLFLVDDHAVVREGLRLVLEDQADLEVVGEASNAEAAPDAIVETQPDVVLMDVSMGKVDGIEATARVTTRCPQTRVIILSMLGTRENVARALRAGASGYLLKESAGREVVEAVRRVAAGERYFGQSVRGADEEAFSSPIDQLSRREKEVLHLLVEGVVPKDIAAQLGISPKTVDTYRVRLMSKLEVANLAGLIKLAIRHGLTRADE